MKTMFRLGWGSVEEIEVTKTSKKSVWFMAKGYGNNPSVESRELLKTTCYKWYNTKQEAVDTLIAELNNKVDDAEYRLKLAKSNLEAAKKEHK